jgi:hypothetical protein
MKLNGWKRIGIVASMAWFFGAGTYTLIVTRARDMSVADTIEQNCLIFQVPHNPAQCSKEYNDNLALWARAWQLIAASVAIVPVPLGWGFAYLTIFLVRWITRGFQAHGISS